MPFEVFLPRQNEGQRLVMRVESEREKSRRESVRLRNSSTSIVSPLNSTPEAAHEGRAPFLVAHFVAARIEPHHVLDLRSANAPALEKLRTPENRMIAPELDQLLGEIEKLPSAPRRVPR